LERTPREGSLRSLVDVLASYGNLRRGLVAETELRSTISKDM
jgi:hypothetical protein